MGSSKYIKDFYGKILGELYDDGGTITAKDFYGRILGTYEKSSDYTKDFYGKILTQGDTTSHLIMENAKKR